jgi:TetR/AcrR family transcriptional regulator, mexJK operon transcriptional repressor
MAAEFPENHENAGLILREGWLLFMEKGYRGTTVDELCRRCGLTKPTLYYYFQDKENLFVCVLQHQLRGFHAVIEQPGTLTEQLQRIATSILVSFPTEYTVILRDREHLKNPDNLKRIRDAFHSEMFGPLIALMQAGVERGELEPDRPDTLSRVFLGIINNFIGRPARQSGDPNALAALLVRYFLGGAQKKTAR